MHSCITVTVKKKKKKVSVLISLISDTRCMHRFDIKLIFGTGRWLRGLLLHRHGLARYCSTSGIGPLPTGSNNKMKNRPHTSYVYFRDMLFYRKHSVAWCFLNNQPTWACLVTCIHSILDFGVVKSKLNLHLYITGSFYTVVVFLYRIFFLVSYIMNLANCLKGIAT